MMGGVGKECAEESKVILNWLNHWALGSTSLDILTAKINKFLLLFKLFWIVLIQQLTEKCHRLKQSILIKIWFARNKIFVLVADKISHVIMCRFTYGNIMYHNEVCKIFKILQTVSCIMLKKQPAPPSLWPERTKAYFSLILHACICQGSQGKQNQ